MLEGVIFLLKACPFLQMPVQTKTTFLIVILIFNFTTRSKLLQMQMQIKCKKSLELYAREIFTVVISLSGTAIMSAFYFSESGQCGARCWARGARRSARWRLDFGPFRDWRAAHQHHEHSSSCHCEQHCHCFLHRSTSTCTATTTAAAAGFSELSVEH